MTRRFQFIDVIVLMAVVAAVGVAARPSPDTHQPPAGSGDSARMAGPVPEFAAAKESRASFTAAIAGAEQVLQAEERRALALAESERAQAEAARTIEARREAAISRARNLRQASLAREKERFDARIASMAEENTVLVEDAIKREEHAIAVSHATVDQRNRDQWNDLSRFLVSGVTAIDATPSTAPT